MTNSRKLKPTYPRLSKMFGLSEKTIGNLKRSKDPSKYRHYQALKDYFMKYQREEK